MLKPSRSRSAALKRADTYFQKYIRLRDKDKACITCGKYDASRYEAGHFMVRQHLCTRYEEKNCHKQCHNCNYYYQGRQVEHGHQIDKLYGEGTAHELYLKSKMTCKKDTYTLDEIANYYNDKIRELTQAGKFNTTAKS